MDNEDGADRWARIEKLFAEALDLPAEERAAFLAGACGPDTPLRKEVEQLLAADLAANGVLDRPWAADEAMPASSSLAAGQSVGAWRIVSELGRGGMGVVYLAERADGTYDQKVALKIIRGGLLAASSESRFARERRILGRLQHRNIARLLDAGATADGLPYLVMELVRGATITDWCRERALGIDARLQLVLQVCDALQHAHQNLVVHRDLKPGNILVDDNGDVRLLDFGVARLLSGADVDAPPLTRQGMLPVTPEYAAPEQLSEVDVTTAADIFSLGAVLCELLTNRRPREGLSGSPVEIFRLLQEPVAAPSSSADAPPEWRRQLRGDLDAIVLKAMAPEPARRYASVAELADDICRYLAHEPVQARPETFAYRAGKFVRRHRAGVAAVAAVVVATGAGVATTAWQAQEARTQAAKAESVKEFVLSLFEGVDPARALGKELTARQLVDDGAARMQGELAGQDLVKAEVLTFLAHMYDKLDDDDRALQLVTEALQLLDDSDTGELAGALLVRGRIHTGRTEDEAAVADLERALPMLRSLGRDLDAAEAMDLLSIVRSRQNELAEATRLTEAALALRLPLLGEDHTEVAASYNNLGVLARTQGDYPQARAHYAKALDIRRRVLPEDHPQLAISLNNLGALEYADGDYGRAADFFAESLAINRRVNGDSHHDTIASLNNYGFMLMRFGQLDDARAALTEVYDYWVAEDKAEHPNALVTRVNLAAVSRAAGDAQAALDEFRQLEPMLAAKLGAEHPFVAATLHHEARCLLDLGDPDAAEVLIEKALAMREKAFGADHPDGADLIRDQALIALQRGDVATSRQLATKAIELQRSKLSGEHPSIATSEILLGRIALAAGDARAALQHHEVALRILGRIFPDDHAEVAEVRAEIERTMLAIEQDDGSQAVGDAQ